MRARVHLGTGQWLMQTELHEGQKSKKGTPLRMKSQPASRLRDSVTLQVSGEAVAARQSNGSPFLGQKSLGDRFRLGAKGCSCGPPSCTCKVEGCVGSI